MRQQTRPGARRRGSRSPRSWWPQRGRQRTGTGRKWLEGTGRRLGLLVRTQGRARTVTGQGWQGSPRWAARWLVGRCSGESACGPSRGSVLSAEWEGREGCIGPLHAPLCPAPACVPIYKTDAATCRCAPTPGPLHGQCHHPRGHLTPVPVVPSSDSTPALPHLHRTHCPMYNTWSLFKLGDLGHGGLQSSRPVGNKPLGEWYSSHARYPPLPPRYPYSLATHYLPSTPLQPGARGCWAPRCARDLIYCPTSTATPKSEMPSVLCQVTTQALQEGTSRPEPLLAPSRCGNASGATCCPRLCLSPGSTAPLQETGQAMGNDKGHSPTAGSASMASLPLSRPRERAEPLWAPGLSAAAPPPVCPV